MSRRFGFVVLLAAFLTMMLAAGGFGCGGISPSEPTSVAALTGRVTDATQTPLAAATVVVTPSGSKAVTGTTLPTGFYTISGLPTGGATVTVSANGYVTFSTTITLSKGSNVLNVALAKAP